MTKYYFEDNGNPHCFTLQYYIEKMKEYGIPQLVVYEAKIDIGNGYFYCRHFREIGEVGEGCGKECHAYSPRNGKNGRCRFSANTYSQTKIKKTLHTKCG